jgi:hypothetical protein
MLETPVRLTPARILRPTTPTSERIMVKAIMVAPKKLPQRILRVEWSFSDKNLPSKKISAMRNPTSVETAVSSTRTSKIFSY